jgi:single-strand DNA-binding protein
MNKAVLMGRLTKDPDVRYTQGDQPMAIARYTLAVDRRRGRSDSDQQTADFISCVAFGKAGEFTEKYLHKGMKICVAGRIQTGSYTRQDGNKVYTTDVVVEGQEFCEGRAANDVAHNYSTPAPQSSGTSAALDGFMNIPEGIDEELPFN